MGVLANPCLLALYLRLWAIVCWAGVVGTHLALEDKPWRSADRKDGLADNGTR